MKITIQKPETLIRLSASTFNGGQHDDDINLTLTDIASSKVGEKWECTQSSNIVRGWHEMEAEVIFKDEKGALVRVTEHGVKGGSDDYYDYEEVELRYIILNSATPKE